MLLHFFFLTEYLNIIAQEKKKKANYLFNII